MNRPPKTLAHFGPHDEVMDWGWDGTLRPFYEAAISTISAAERRLLWIGTDKGWLALDSESDELPDQAADDELIKEIDSALRDLAGRRREQRRRPTHGLVPWAPPNSNPVATAVLAPKGQLTWVRYLDLMQERVAHMIQEAGEDQAREAIKAYLPQEENWFLNSPIEKWAPGLMEEGELVESGLLNNLPEGSNNFPLEVNGPNPWAKQGLTADLETWLNLVIPRELD